MLRRRREPTTEEQITARYQAAAAAREQQTREDTARDARQREWEDNLHAKRARCPYRHNGHRDRAGQPCLGH